MEELKRCSKCKIPKPLNEFHKRKNSKDGHDHYCKECGNSLHRERYSIHPEYRINRRYKVYMINKNEFNNLLNNQNNKCKICNTDFKSDRKTYVDHNHLTNKIRGLLCPKCNNLLGACNDNIEILQLAISYLKTNN